MFEQFFLLSINKLFSKKLYCIFKIIVTAYISPVNLNCGVIFEVWALDCKILWM